MSASSGWYQDLASNFVALADKDEGKSYWNNYNYSASNQAQ